MVGKQLEFLHDTGIHKKFPKRLLLCNFLRILLAIRLHRFRTFIGSCYLYKQRRRLRSVNFYRLNLDKIKVAICIIFVQGVYRFYMFHSRLFHNPDSRLDIGNGTCIGEQFSQMVVVACSELIFNNDAVSAIILGNDINPEVSRRCFFLRIDQFFADNSANLGNMFAKPRSKVHIFLWPDKADILYNLYRSDFRFFHKKLLV